MGEVRRRTLAGQIGAAAQRTARGVSQGGGDAVELARLAQAGRTGSAASTVSRDGATLAVSTAFPPGTGAPATGPPMVVPAGTWIAQITVMGDYDDIFAAALNVAPGSDWGAWTAHRPTSAGPATGTGYIGVIAGPRTVTPAAMVEGSVGDDVTVTLILTRGG